MNYILTLLYLTVGSWVFAQDTYTLASESALAIDGTSTLHDWTVVANTMEGTLSTAEMAPEKIDFKVKVADILSDRGATMDKKMHNALKMESHPMVVFTLKTLKDQTTLVGVLDIAGVEKEVQIDAKIDTTSDTIKIVGEKKITLQDYNMEPPSAMFGQIVVGDEVVVKFDLVFSKG